MRTRLDPSPRKNKDEGYGWGRKCVDCDGPINHLHAGDLCYRCEEAQERREAEEVAA